MRRLLTLAACVLSALFLPGCWDYRTMNTRAAMLGLAVDPSTDGDPEKIHLTVQYPLFSTSGGDQSGSSGSSKNHAELSTDTYSVTDGIKILQNKLDKSIDTSQLQAVVFSTKLSQNQLDNTVEDLFRQPRSNRLSYAAATDENAGQILMANVPNEAAADNLERRLSSSTSQQGYVIRKHLWEFWRDITAFGNVPVLPYVSVEQSEGHAEESSESLVTNGVEVYPLDDKPYYLQGDNTFDVNLLLGKVEKFNTVVPVKNDKVILNDVKSRSTLTCFKNGNRFVFKANIRIRATLGRQPNTSLRSMRPADLNVIQTQVANYEREHVLKTMQLLQEHGTDVVGFGAIYMQRHPEDAKMIDEEWSKSFRTGISQVNVKVTISSKGTMV